MTADYTAHAKLLCQQVTSAAEALCGPLPDGVSVHIDQNGFYFRLDTDRYE